MLEGIEDAREDFGRDPDPGIAHLYPHAIVVHRGNADIDVAAFGRELRGIFQEVPKNLLQAGRVGLPMIGVTGQVTVQVYALFQNERSARLANVAHRRVHVNRLHVQTQFPGGDAAQVQKIINQPGFQFDVSPDHRHVVAKRRC